ncbi:PspA/IM30 family protein [Balneolaceae bacterium ANBcel3]|nr:PspA/IM30 family protein [Balneolaceae bacterium ANBcel3]
MWKRFVRAIKSIFGGAVGAMEDPKRILEMNIQELNDQVPVMNENIATVKANVMLLQKEEEKYGKQVSEMTLRIKSAIQAGRDDIAQNYAIQLERSKESFNATRQQLKHAVQAYEKALQIKRTFMHEKDRKIREAREAMRESERSAWQARVADTLEQFEVGGLDATHDEMISRIKEETARNEARMEMALDSVDSNALELEFDAEKIRAAELVSRFKKEMNPPKAITAGNDPSKEIFIEELEPGIISHTKSQLNQNHHA